MRLELTVQDRGTLLSVLLNEKTSWAEYRIAASLKGVIGLSESEVQRAQIGEDGSIVNNFKSAIDLTDAEHALAVKVLTALLHRLDREGASGADWSLLAPTFETFGVGA